MLKNEKYIGDMLLQKYYTKDHLTKRDTINKGELPQYYVENSHEGIISKDDFKAVQGILKSKPHLPPKEYDFKGMVFCGICGNRYARKKNYKKYVWRCHVFHNQGKAKCPSKQVPDELLKDKAKDFDKEISKIIVFPNNQLKFIFVYNSEVITTWEQTSRKNSWTEDMKETARQKTLLRKKREALCQEK